MRRFAYMVLYLCILCVTGAYAQNEREQVSAQGEQLFQHTIEQGQTVYSIATMYGVSVDDIYRLNPGSKEQIKSGEILLIPQKQHSKENTTEKKDEDGQYTYHTIKPRETLYSVSVRYQIPATRIIEANPGLSTKTFLIGKTIRIPSLTEEKVEKILNRIQSHAEREQQLIEKIRQYARRDRQTAEKIDAVRVVKEIVHKTALTFPQKMLVNVHCLNEHVFVQMDAFELEIVVINLLKNAYQAVAAQQNRKIDLTVVENKNFLEVSVSDNGPYIDDEKLARMERPFQSSKPDGFGLGLHICRMIALRYGGKLQIERLSQEGGIVITVSFIKECR